MNARDAPWAGEAAALRRGACPTLAAPMASGDGLLARLAPAELTPGQLAGLARAAARHGNGLVEVTARGSLQVRGLRPETAPGLAAEVAALGITVPEGPTVLVGALAGLDPGELGDPRPLAAALCGFGGTLPPKVSVVVDGGGALNLDAVAADVRVRATAGGWEVTGTGGRFDAAGAVAAALALLARLSERGARARELGLAIAVAEPRATVPAVGGFRLREGVARGFALPFGQAEAADLVALAEASEAPFRPAPGRALVAVGLDAAAEARLLGQAERLGFVTDADDPRLRVSACAGAPACGSGRLPTKAIARRVAGLADGFALHLSGCEKRCAQPAGPAVTLVGAAGGPEVTGDGMAVPDALRARLLAEAGR
ncbi:MAG: hypothetical protein U1E59_07155 [Amaricoccus sp.]